MRELLIVLVFYEGKETIIDFKQSNKPKKESYIEDYFHSTRSLFPGS